MKHRVRHYLSTMDLDSLHRIGRLGKPWGHRGELLIHFEDGDPDELVHEGWFFVDIEGQKVPFRFTSMREQGRAGVVVKFEDFADPSSAGILVGRELYAPPGLLADGSDESWDPETFIGMVVRDVEHGELGEVTGLEGTEDHPVMVIQHGEVEVMVPLAGDLIVSIDAEERVMVVRTPPGLLDLYRKP